MELECKFDETKLNIYLELIKEIVLPRRRGCPNKLEKIIKSRQVKKNNLLN